MIEYVNPSTFEHTVQQGEQPKQRGYPVNWSKPFWHGNNKYNPHMRVLLNEPDGTRIYFDPVTTTYSFEHSSGYHRTILNDSVVENVPGRKVSFVGGGGESHTVSGHSDTTYAGHVRQNFQGDHYQNYKGVHHAFYQQGAVSVNMGNQTHEHYGNVKQRIMGNNGAWGVGVGPGDGNNHDNALTITNKRMYMRAYTKSDMVMQTQSNSMYHASGKEYNVAAVTDINMSANSNATFHSQQTFSIESKGDTVHIKSSSPIYLEAPIVWVTQDKLFVAGEVHAKSFIVDPQPFDPPKPPAMPDTPPATS